jgi:lysophospholipase L1-like esterase
VPATYTVPTATGGVQPVNVSCTPTPGSPFPIGTTAVQCTATAANGQTGACSFSVTVTPPLPRLAETNFMAFGDSMTLGEVTFPVATTSDLDGFRSFKMQIVPTAAYPRQLQLQLAARYTQQTIQMANFGISGETANNGAKRFPSVIASARPEVVLLLEGANDLRSLGEAGASVTVSAVESMAREARMRNARVFVAGLPPPRPGGRNSLALTTVQAFNSRLAAMAAGERAVFIDLYSALLAGVNTYIGNDGLHPTEAGYQKIAETFFNAIRTDLEVRVQP